MQPVVQGLAMAVIVVVKGQRKRRLVTQDNPVPPDRDPQQAAARLVQEYGLAERAAEFVYGRLRDHPEGDSRQSTGERSWRSSKRPAGARCSAAISCVSRFGAEAGRLVPSGP